MQRRIKKRNDEKSKTQFEFEYEYHRDDNDRDITSDLWIDFGRTKGLTYGEMSPIEICQSNIKHCIKGIEIELKGTFRNDPDYLLRALTGQFNMLKNWQYILHCVLYYERFGRSSYEKQK